MSCNLFSSHAYPNLGEKSCFDFAFLEPSALHIAKVKINS